MATTSLPSSASARSSTRRTLSFKLSSSFSPTTRRPLITVSSVHFLIITDLVKPTTFFFPTGSTIGQVYNLIGFHRYNDLSVFNILRLSCLDFVVLLVTCMVYAFCVRSYNAKLAKDSSRENISRPVSGRDNISFISFSKE